MAQIHPLINTASHFTVLAIFGNIDCYQLLQLVLVHNAAGKIFQAEEAYVTITRQRAQLPHPARLWRIQVFPSFADGVVHKLTPKIDLKLLPSILLKVARPIVIADTIRSTVCHHNIGLMHNTIQKPEEYSQVPPINAQGGKVVSGVHIVVVD